MAEETIFSKIIRGEISAEIVYQDDLVTAFRDINPQAPTHVLVIPKRHIATINDIGTEDTELIGKLYLAAARVARDAGFAEEGYRAVMNCNGRAGQTVFHLHLHVLGGRDMNWPPG